MIENGFHRIPEENYEKPTQSPDCHCNYPYNYLSEETPPFAPTNHFHRTRAHASLDSTLQEDKLVQNDFVSIFCRLEKR